MGTRSVGRSRIRRASAWRSSAWSPAASRRASRRRTRPTIYYYPQQAGTPLEEGGPARVRVPMRSPLADAMLDANVVSASYFDAIGLAPMAGSIFPDDPVA